jgi:cytochrome c oxidase subunit 2
MVVLMRIVSVVFVAVVLALGVPVRGGQPEAAAGKTQVVDVAAERFSFHPSEIRTTVGTELQIRLKSDDTSHGFRIVGTNVNVEIPKRSRGTITVTFTPEAVGRYTFECSQLCGAGHSFMRGVIVATEAETR